MEQVRNIFDYRFFRKGKKIAKHIFVWYLIVFFFLGPVTPVYAQEATWAAQLISEDATKAAQFAFSKEIPQLRLPFDGNYSDVLEFGEEYESQSIAKQMAEKGIALHNGIDFAMPEGTPILAVDDGEVVVSGDGDFGITVKITHSWGASVYGHLQETKVAVGQKVGKGELLGLSGKTGITEGPHLHFGIKPVVPILENFFGFIDPKPYLSSSVILASDEGARPESKDAGQVSMTLSQNDKQQITSSSATPSNDSNSVAGIATSSAFLTAENVATDSAYLFNYKFDLKKGTTAHFYDKATKRPSFAIANESYDYKLRFFLENQESRIKNQGESSSSVISNNPPVILNDSEGSQDSSPALRDQNDITPNGNEPKVDGNKVEFPVIVKGIPMTLRYTIEENKVKEEFIIAEKPTEELLTSQGEALQIPFSVNTVGLTQEYKNGEYIFTSKDGAVVWRILAPTVEDSKGRKGTQEEVKLDIHSVILASDKGARPESTDSGVLAATRPQNDTVTSTAVLGVSTAFLKEAQYPVIIDPTWTQSTWDGGSGISTTNQFSSSSSVTTSMAGQVTLTNSEKLTNTTFESNVTSWNTGVQPDSISGMKLWLKADAITGLADDALVTSWTDSSGNSNNAAQANTNLQPKYKANIINTSYPVVRFDGINDYLATPSITQNQPLTMFAVTIRRGLTTTFNRVIFPAGGGGQPEMGFANGSNLVYAFAGNGSYPTKAATDNAFHILSGIFNTTSSILGVDGSTTTGNVGVGNVNAAVHIGGTATTLPLSGDIAEVLIYSGAFSTANRTRIENYLRDKYAITVSSGITSATRSTTQAHAGAASAKLITSSTDTGEFTQTVNVGDTNTYNLTAYAYTTGDAAVTTSDVELFYNGSTVATTITDAGNGWYKLSGTVTGANASRIYGVQVKANRTVYVDDMSLNGYASSGSLTSAIFDTGQRSDWGALTYNATVPANSTVSIKARTSNNSDMTGATAFSSCSAITSGSDISSNSCVTDTHRYIQYEVSLTSTDTATATATFQDISIGYSLSLPDAPSSLSGSPSTSSITWSWTDNSSDEDGFYVQDTSGNTKCTVSTAGTTTCTETGLTPNTSYTRRVVAYNASGNSSTSSDVSAITLSTLPTTSNITSSRSTSTWYNTASFTFTNGIGFGAGGVEYLMYVWDTSSTHTWTGSETQWTSSTLTQTATSEGNSWYLHLKGYNSNNTENGTLDFGPFYFDETAPNSVSLESPSDSIYTSSSRPTFRWKVATTPDATAGILKYQFSLDTTSGNYITIDNIPTSGTADVSNDKYVIQYEGFSDSDSANNYISIYTKSSSSWESSANDGKLKEGKNTWRVIAVDNAGNTKESSRTIYADFANPALSDVTLKNIGIKDSYAITTNQKPIITGTIADTVAPESIVLSFYKQNFFLGVETDEELVVSENYSLQNNKNNTSITFSYTLSQLLDYGKYRLVVTGLDKAGNRSSAVTILFQLLTTEKANQLLTQEKTDEKKDQLEESPVSLVELEKKAILRREKEANELQLAIQELQQEMSLLVSGTQTLIASLGGFLIQTGENLGIGLTETSVAVLGFMRSTSQTIASSVQTTTTAFIFQTEQGINGIFTAVEKATTNGNTELAQLQNGVKEQIAQEQEILIASLPSANTIVKRGEQLVIAVSEQIQQVNKSVDVVVTNVLVATGTTFTNSTNAIGIGFATINTGLTSSQETVQKHIVSSQQEVTESFSKLLHNIAVTSKLGQEIVSGMIIAMNNNISDTEKDVKKQIAQTHKQSTKKLDEAGEGIQVAFRSIIKPAVETKNFADRVGKGITIAISTFNAYVFDESPTKIAKVTIEELGKDYIVISWETNHYTRANKVNYGETLSYGKEVWGKDGEKHHQVKITGLSSGKRYFFEVMGQNKNYVYDAYYSFETKK